MNKHIALRASAAVIALACTAGPALAQNLQQGSLDNPNEVLSRPRPGYDATGIKAGGFTILPYATADLAYDDNIFASDKFKKSDEIALVTAGAQIHSNWSRNSFDLKVAGATEQFVHNTDQNNQTADVEGRGTLDVRRDFSLGLDARYAHLTEPRGSLGDVFVGGSPSQYDLKELTGTVRATPGAFTIVGDAGVHDFQYYAIDFNRQHLNQSYRNYHELTANGRIAYSISPSISPYVDFTYNSVYYAHRGDLGLNFDSHGSEVVGGVKLTLSRLVVGEFGVGYVHQHLDDPRFHDISGFAYKGKVVWNPTTLISVTVSGDTTIGQSGIIGSGAVLKHELRAEGDYELLRNLILHAEVQGDNYSYHGIDRTDRYRTGGVGARYLMTQVLSFGLTYSHSHQNSHGDDARVFSDNRVAFSIRLQR